MPEGSRDDAMEVERHGERCPCPECCEGSRDEQVEKAIAGIAYHIDKCCTGGTAEDFEAARMIWNGLVEGRIRGPWSEAEAERDEAREALRRIEPKLRRILRDPATDGVPSWVLAEIGNAQEVARAALDHARPEGES